jgi:3-hydroxybutyryl-CoA dehydrogenase
MSRCLLDSTRARAFSAIPVRSITTWIPPDRQDRDRDQGPLGLHRQHAAGPVSDGRCEFIGIDVRYSVCKELSEEFKRPEYAPPPLFKRMVAAGRHGRKTGRGFYEYERKPTPVAA